MKMTLGLLPSDDFPIFVSFDRVVMDSVVTVGMIEVEGTGVGAGRGVWGKDGYSIWRPTEFKVPAVFRSSL